MNNPTVSLSEQAHLHLPGFVVVGITTLAALFLSEHYGAPVMLLALLLGIALAFLHEETKCKLGIEFVASRVLRFGVALIGLRIAITDLLALGWQTGLVLIAAICSSIFLGMLLARAFGISRQFGALSGGAVGICGASAALAISSVLPDDKNKQRDTLLTVIGVTILSTVAMIIYPIIAKALQLTSVETSIFLGGTIHDVLATLTKLVRVSFLVPVVVIFMLAARANKKNQNSSVSGVFPFFLVAFIALMVLNSLVSLPPVVIDTASGVSRFALVAAIAAIGMKSY